MAGLRRTAGLPPLPLAGGAKPPPKAKDAAPGRRGLDDALAEQMQAIGAAARAAARELATAASADKAKALHQAAAAIRAGKGEILAANRRDLETAQQHELSAAMRDRLTLDEKRIEAMARGLEDVAALPEPVGRVLAAWTQPNGLSFERLSVPLGVIGIIYESRPN